MSQPSSTLFLSEDDPACKLYETDMLKIARNAQKHDVLERVRTVQNCDVLIRGRSIQKGKDSSDECLFLCLSPSRLCRYQVQYVSVSIYDCVHCAKI